jgi:hypothetical protein
VLPSQVAVIPVRLHPVVPYRPAHVDRRLFKAHRLSADHMRKTSGGSGMAGTTRAFTGRRLGLVPAVAVVCLLAGCQSGSTTAGAAPVSQASGTVVPPAAAPIPVTVAPATVAPGAIRTGPPTAPAVLALPMPSPAPYVAPCLPIPSPKHMALQVSPGSGSAVVGWVSDGDGSVRSYRVSAISQRLVAGTQAAPPTATVAHGVGCGPRSISFSGLRHGAAYVFWLEEGIPDRAGGLRFWQVGRSAGVVVG